MQVISGKSNESVTFKNGINNGLLYQWICEYNDLIDQKKGRKPKELKMNISRQKTKCIMDANGIAPMS